RGNLFSLDRPGPLAQLISLVEPNTETTAVISAFGRGVHAGAHSVAHGSAVPTTDQSDATGTPCGVAEERGTCPLSAWRAGRPAPPGCLLPSPDSSSP